MPHLVDCARAYASEGEICDALREVWGVYRETPVFGSTHRIPRQWTPGAWTTSRGERAGAGALYRGFLRVESMSAGLYVLEAGAADPQSPHAQDEVYYVVSGRARVHVGRRRNEGAPATSSSSPRRRSIASTRSRSGSACSSCSPRRDRGMSRMKHRDRPAYHGSDTLALV